MKITISFLEKIPSLVLIGLSFLIFVIVPALLFICTTWITFGTTGFDLAGEWNQCIIDARNITEAKSLEKNCEWKSVQFPTSRKLEPHPQSTFRVLKKNFNPPELCRDDNVGCSILFGRIGDASEFYLNGEFLSRFIEFSPNFISTYAYSIQIPLPRGLKSESELTVFSEIIPSPSVTRLEGPPIKILPSQIAFRFSQLLNAYTSTLPIFSAGITVLFGVITALIGRFFGASGQHADKLKRILTFSIFSSLFLFGMSRLPREFFSFEAYPPLHYCMRTLADYSTIRLYQGTWNIENVATRMLSKSLAVAAIVYGLIFAHTLFFTPIHGADQFHASQLFYLSTFPTGIVLGIIGIKLFRSKKNRAVAIFTIFISTTDILDACFLNFLKSDFYTVRFAFQFKVLILIFFSGLIYSRLVFRIMNEATLGRTISVLLHDLKSTAMALRILSRQSNQEISEENKNLLTAALDRLDSMTQEVLSISKQKIESKETLMNCNVVDVLNQACAEHNLIATQTDSQIASIFKIDSNRTLNLPNYHLYRIIGNLIINSLQAQEKTTVTVEAFEAESDIVIVVKDDAGGFKHEPSLIGSEHGIGLYSCKLLTESYGGTFTIRTKEGKGTETEVRLPSQKS